MFKLKKVRIYMKIKEGRDYQIYIKRGLIHDMTEPSNTGKMHKIQNHQIQAIKCIKYRTIKYRQNA